MESFLYKLAMIKFGPYIEKKQAKELGSTYYMTGRPCKNGHVDRKMTSSNKCESCKVRTDERRAYEAAWKRKKREDPNFVLLENERRAAWLAKDGVSEALRDRIRAYNKRLYRESDEFRNKKLKYSAEWQARNPEKTRDASRRWVAKNPDKVRLANHRRRDHRSITQGRVDDVDISKLFRDSFGFCKYCTSPLFDGYHLDHIMPLHLGGGNDMDNLQCICARCNLRKGRKHPDVWHGEIGWLSEQIKE